MRTKRVHLFIRKLLSSFMLCAMLLAAVGPVNFAVADDFTGDDGPNTINGTSGADNIDALGGDDTVNAGGGADVINGGLGDDTLNGQTGNDVIDGGLGDDNVNGNGGTDTLTGGPGDDAINGGNGTDSLVENMGTNYIEVLATPTPVPAAIPTSGPSADWGCWRSGGWVRCRDVTMIASIGTPVPNGTYENSSSTSTDLNYTLTDSNLITDFETSKDGTLTTSMATSYSGTVQRQWSLFGILWFNWGGPNSLNGYGVSNIDSTIDFVGNGTFTDTLSNLEAVTLTGNERDNVITGSSYTRSGVTFSGMGGDDTITGTEQQDLLLGGDGEDTINGLGGNDQIWGGADNDTLNGGDGIDDIYGEGGNDTINGGNDADNLFGGAGDDEINGEAGSDLINGDQGNDFIDGGVGDDVLNGGADNDTLLGSEGIDTINGNAGNDALLGGTGNDDLSGGEGSDLVFGGEGNDSDSLDGGLGGDLVVGGDGDDTMYGDEGVPFAASGAGADYLIGGAGNDTIYGNGNNDTLVGGAGDDTLDGGYGIDCLVGDSTADVFCLPFFAGSQNPADYGTGDLSGIPLSELMALQANLDTSGPASGNDYLYGYEDMDFLFGGDGDDYLYGGKDANGNEYIQTNPMLYMQMTDFLSGGAGNDYLEGNAGDDLLDGGSGNDLLLGGDGNDSMEGGDGNDDLWAGSGDDTASGGLGNDNIYGEGGEDTLNGGDGFDYLSGGAGDDEMYGNEGDDMLDGAEGDDYLDGGFGNDILSGGVGGDILYAGDGNDTIDGGAGDDVITGDAGNDTIYTSEGADQINAGADDDTIFVLGSNGLSESAPTFINGGSGSNYFQFIAGAWGDLVLTSEGTDTLDFSQYDRGITMDMSRTDRQEVATWDEGGGTFRSLWITLSGFFTNLVGTEYDDTLNGNDIANNIEGRGGNDGIGGGGGLDNIYGGDQTDLLDSMDDTDGIDTDLDAVAVPGSVVKEDNWYSIELPVALAVPNGDDEEEGGGIFPFIIPVTGDEPVNLVCLAPDQTFQLLLPNGDWVRIYGLCLDMDGTNYWANLVKEEKETLPADVDPYNFGKGMTLTLWEGADLNSLIPLPKVVDNVSYEYSMFVAPENRDEKLMEMFWDTIEPGGKWSALPEYVQDENGNPVRTELHPGKNDGMWIDSGSQMLGGNMDVITNFYGTLLMVME